jgi:uncharacterized protein (TIGR03437 family)
LEDQPVINAGGAVNGASCSPVGLPNSAIARGSTFRGFAPFALALLITAGAQAASVSSTLTLTGTATITASGYVNSGQITLTNVGSGTFASTIPLSAITGSTVMANFTITLSGGTLFGSFTEPVDILSGSSGNASATITGGTGSFAGYTGSFPTLAGSSSSSGSLSYTFTFTGSGTVNTSGGGTFVPSQTSVALSAASGANTSTTVNLTTSSAGSIAFSVTPVTTSGGNWLTATADTYTVNSASYAILTIGAPNGITLSSGTYYGTVTIAPTGGGSSTEISVTLTVGSGGGAGTPQFNLNSSNSNTVTVSPSISMAMVVNVASTLAGTTEITFTMSGPTYATGDAAWLNVTSSGALTTPVGVSFAISGQAGQLSPGQHTAAVTVHATSPASGVTNATITITYTASGGGLTLGTSSMTFSAQQNGTAPAAQTLTVGASGVTYYTANATSTGNWLSISPTGSLNTSSNPSIRVSVNQTGLTANAYYGTITLVANGVTQTVQVTLVVSSPSTGGGLTLGTSSMTFSAQQNGTAPPPQTLSISAPSTTYYTASATSVGNWLGISPMGSLNTTSNPSIAVSVIQSSLTASTYYGTITLVANGITQQVQVTLVVSSATSTDGTGNVMVTANNQAGTPSLSFTYQVGGSTPTVQTLQVVSASGSSAVAFTITSSATWLSVGVANGTSLNTPVNNPGFTISIVNPSNLSPGPYSATITVAPNGGTVVSVPVSLTVTPAPTVTATPTTLAFSWQVGSANPTPSSVTVGGGANLTLSAVVTGGGNWLSVSPTSGTTGTAGTVAVTVTATPGTLGAGSYTGTILVSGTGTAGGATTITVILTVTAPLPTIASVVNAASYAIGALSPGELVTLFGTAIGPATSASATTDPATGKLATTIGGVQVLFNGTAAPMIYASSTQVSAVVPYEMAPLASPSVWIKYAGQASNAYQLTTAATAPGLFTQNASGSGPGAILNQDNSVNGPGNRAAKGSIVQVFMTGEGQTSPPSVTGAITSATLPPPQVTPAPLLAVGVTINGQPALYVYAGEAPSLVAGMMQLNVQIPANAPSGDLAILVSIGGHTSQNGVTVSVQ